MTWATRQRRVAAILVVVGTLLGGCAVRTAEPPSDTEETTAPTLRPGDRIELAVEGQPDLSGTFELDRDGRFEMPLIGTVDAYDQTTDELEAALVASLADGFLRAPEVRVARAAPRPVFVFGAIARPGSYVFQDALTVRDVIEGAGGALDDLDTLELLLSPAGRASEARPVGLDQPLAPGDVLELKEPAA